MTNPSTPQSIRARLLNMAEGDNKTFQQLVVRYFHERLLYRLSSSPYKERFILKGGALLYAFEEFVPRPTLDIVEAFAEENPSAVVSNLFVEYPDGNIDVEAEQKKVLDADTIVLQFPIEWYEAPSIMHKWFEDVLAYGFAFGRGGDKVQGKRLIDSFTSGTPADTYVLGGLQSYPIDYFMYPLIALANRCGMKWDGYVYTGGVMAAFADEEQIKQLASACKDHAKRLTDKINEK